MSKNMFLQNPVEWSRRADNRRIFRGESAGHRMNGAKSGMNGVTNGNGYATICPENLVISC
jgi:hypothetical protein